MIHQQSEAIQLVFAELLIPLNPEVRSWNSLHFVRRLRRSPAGDLHYFGLGLTG